MKPFRKTITVRVPEWDSEPIKLQELSIGDMGPIMEKQNDRVQFAIEVAGRCLIDTDGNPLGADWIRENAGVSRLSGLMIILEHCMDLNGFNKDDDTKQTREERKKANKESLDRAPVENASGAGARKDGRGAGRSANAAGVA